MEQPSLWQLETYWLQIPRDSSNSTYVNAIPYRSWTDFMDCKPYKMNKPYILSSWAWRNDEFQIVFTTPYINGMGTMFISFPVKKMDEPEIRTWLKKHMSPIWKI